MSVPQFVFLDTNVFAGQQYNFDSTALKTFLAAAKPYNINLLLPDPIEREVRRQIRERSNEALAALNEARRSAPFLKKWAHFPKQSFPAVADWEVTQLAQQEWQEFLKQFTVRRLDYEGVSVAKVMIWYDNIKSPFGAGKKRKEFPDAFAVAILDKFAADHGCAIAVVSDDQDMKLACDTRHAFLHFTNLPRLTELLVAGEEKVAPLRETILSDLSLVGDALKDEASNLTYYHAHGDYEITDSDLESTDIMDVRIVALGHGQATLAFEATVEASHTLEWKEQDFNDEWVWERGTFLDSGTVHGMAKVELDPKTRAISAVTSLELEEAELEVTETPRYR